jgi:hypothetical protein
MFAGREAADDRLPHTRAALSVASNKRREPAYDGSFDSLKLLANKLGFCIAELEP